MTDENPSAVFAPRWTGMDVAKGVGILLVILGHMSIPETLRQVVYSFHMPLFFLVSGLLHRDNFSGHWALRKLGALLIPYLLWGVLEIATCVWAKGEAAEPLLRNFLLGNGAGVSWFLMCLLLTEFLGAALVWCVRHWRDGWGVDALCVLAVAGAGALVQMSDMPNVLMSRSVLPALAFWLLGRLLGHVGCRAALEGSGWWANLLPLAFLGLGLPLALLQRVDMGGGDCGAPQIFYPAALLMSFAVLVVCLRGIPRSRVLRYLGSRSLLFMGWHVIVPPVMKAVLALCDVDVDAGAGVKIASRVLNVGVLVGLVALCDRYAPVLAGRLRPSGAAAYEPQS